MVSFRFLFFLFTETRDRYFFVYTGRHVLREGGHQSLRELTRARQSLRELMRALQRENMFLAGERHTLTKKSKGNRRSDVSETPIFVDAAFAKVGKSSRQFLEISFSLMTFDGKIVLA